MSLLSKKFGVIPKSLTIVDHKDVYKEFLEKYKADYELLDRGIPEGTVLVARHLISTKDTASGKELHLDESTKNSIANEISEYLSNVRRDATVCALSPLAEKQGSIEPGMCVGVEDMEHYRFPTVQFGDYVLSQIPFNMITGIYKDELSRENYSTGGDKPHNLIVS